MPVIYSADLTFRVFRKQILIGLNPHATELNFLTPVRANKMEVFVHSTNATYVHPSIDSILELCWTFPIGFEL